MTRATLGRATTARPRRDLWYLASAAAVIVAVAVVVLLFGTVRPPTLPSLGDEEWRPSAAVAWAAWDDRGECVELWIARPDGTAEPVVCDPELGDVVGWTDDGIVALAWDHAGQALVTRYPATGEVLSREPAPDVYFPGAAGIYTARSGGVLEVWSVPDDRRVWSVRADRGYEVLVGSTSPDRRWVAMVDSDDRLLVVPRTGADEPAVWVAGLSGTPWAGPVWEGQAVHLEGVAPEDAKG